MTQEECPSLASGGRPVVIGIDHSNSSEMRVAILTVIAWISLLIQWNINNEEHNHRHTCYLMWNKQDSTFAYLYHSNRGYCRHHLCHFFLQKYRLWHQSERLYDHTACMVYNGSHYQVLMVLLVWTTVNLL